VPDVGLGMNNSYPGFLQQLVVQMSQPTKVRIDKMEAQVQKKSISQEIIIHQRYITGQSFSRIPSNIEKDPHYYTEATVYSYNFSPQTDHRYILGRS
jgi:hypothetical protein